MHTAGPRQNILPACRGNPNMNSLIGLGAATSFTAGAASLAVPGMGLEVSFLEEPVMLLAFVLLGRALESRARLKASGLPRSCCRPGAEDQDKEDSCLLLCAVCAFGERAMKRASVIDLTCSAVTSVTVPGACCPASPTQLAAFCRSQACMSLSRLCS